MDPLSIKNHLLPRDWIALILTMALIGLRSMVPTLRQQRKIPERWIASFSGGFAVAYVFLHLLPGLEESNQNLGELLAQYYPLKQWPLLDLGVYLTALAGFLFYFGLERRIENKEAKNKEAKALDFYLHLSSILLLSFIITYTMPLRVEVGKAFAILFTFVMGLHFVIVDRNMEKHFPRYFKKRGMMLLNLALALGWILAAVTEPNNALLVVFLTSFLGGTVLFSVFRNEIPRTHQSTYPAFLIGVGLGTAMLVYLTILEGH